MSRNLSSYFADSLEDDETMLWEDAPSFLLFDTEGYRKITWDGIFRWFELAARGTILIPGIVIPFILIYFIFKFLPWQWKLITAIIVLTGITLKFFRIRNTRYAYSDKRIFISIWNWGKRTTRIIPFSNVGKISKEMYTNGAGILHLMPRKPFTFKGIALLSGFTRHYPTIEFVNNIELIAERMEQQRKKVILGKK